ncbi:hypothetical protein NG791_25710 [Laspinema sp. D1]|uniref:hypothetical protein n=1 Tax=Laspinema palackyanum TaxID=3231601 RepID=UPI00349B29EF|nr:hypothetical protein [Laspinema sp. D2b]
MKARDFIKPNESAVVIFTHGEKFVIHEDNTGLTGEWKISPNRTVERVILYHRDDEKNTNSLYIGNYAGAEPSTLEGRYNIRLTHLQYIGLTSLNWIEFAEGGQNPIRYL